MAEQDRRRRFLVGLSAAALILGFLLAPAFRGRIFTYDDLGNFHLPVRDFYARCLRSGDDFTWQPRLFNGFYLQGEGQGGFYHPLHWLLYRLLPLHWALDLEVWLNYPALLAGLYFFLRRWRLPADAALFGGLVFAFSASTLLHFMHVNGVAVVAHLPWLLLLIDLALRGQARRTRVLAAAGVSLLTASQILLGYPQYLWICLLAEGLYALFTAARERRGWGLLVLGWALALGVLLGAVQLAPTWEALRHSERAAPTAEFLSIGSLFPGNLVQLVAPYLYQSRTVWPAEGSTLDTHEFGLYAGAVAAALWVWLLARLWALGPARPLALAACGLAVLALLLAFGAYSPLFQLTRRLPLLGLFRCSCRYLVLFHLATGVAAAVAFADLSAPRPAPVEWRRLWPLALPPLAALLALALPFTSRGEFTGLELRAAGPAFAVAAALMIAAAARGRPGALAGLILLAALDQGIYGLSFLYSKPPADIASFVAAVPTPPGLAEGQRVGGDRERIELNALTLRGVALSDGYVALMPQRPLHPPPGPDTDPEEAQARRLEVARREGSAWLNLGGEWRRVEHPLPRVRMTSQAQVSAEPASDLPPLDPAEIAVVEEELPLTLGLAGVASLVQDRPGRIEVRTAAPSTQLLIVADSWQRGWEATVDGQPARVVRVYGEFLGCVVGPGEHQVVFRFAPQSLALGKLLSGVGLLLLAATLAIGLRRAGPARRSDPGV
jgi:hypothetical protein